MRDYWIAPSILSADFARLGAEVDAVLAAGADLVHFDVMDNHYVPNLTVGPIVCEALRKHGVTAPIDAHLMIKPVDRIIPDFAAAGASYITFHPEASEHIDRSLQLIRDLVRERSMGLILISHDLGVIAQNVSRMMVMYGGMVVESGPTREVFTRRAHPYTQGLFGSRPQLDMAAHQGGGRRARLAAIPGNVPELRHMPAGCPFAGRCPVAQPTCGDQKPADVRVAPDHHARCVRLEAVA